MKASTLVFSCGIATAFAAAPAGAATITSGGVSDLDNTVFYQDVVAAGGSAAITEGTSRQGGRYALDLDGDGATSDVVPAGTVSFTGFAYQREGNGGGVSRNSARSISLVFTYLGEDGLVGGGDDISTTSVTVTAPGSGSAGSFFVNFDTPLSLAYDGLNNVFTYTTTVNDTDGIAANEIFSTRINGTGGVGNTQANRVAFSGTFTPVPEPGSAALLATGGLLIFARKRRA